MSCRQSPRQDISLGVVDARIKAWDADQFLENRENGGNNRKQKPIEEKESFRWLECWRKACEIQELCPETKVVCVSENKAKDTETRKRRRKRSKRKATGEVRAKRVELRAPYRKGLKLANVAINAIPVREKDGPKDEPPVEWLLLTTLPIGGFVSVNLRPLPNRGRADFYVGQGRH